MSDGKSHPPHITYQYMKRINTSKLKSIITVSYILIFSCVSAQEYFSGKTAKGLIQIYLFEPNCQPRGFYYE